MCTPLEPAFLRAMNGMRGHKPFWLLKRPQLSSPGELEHTYNTFGLSSDALQEYVLRFFVHGLLWPGN